MMRRKYLSPASYIPGTFCGLTWASVQFLTLLFSHLRRGDTRGSLVILRKGAEGIRGTIQGWFSKPKGF